MIWLIAGSEATAQNTVTDAGDPCGVTRVHRITRSERGSPLATPCRKGGGSGRQPGVKAATAAELADVIRKPLRVSLMVSSLEWTDPAG
jgi:hypothetical protein